MEIVVVERGPYVSFANCGLPYYVGGVITDRGALLVQTPEALRARFGLDVRVDTEATAIDRDRKLVHLSGPTGSYTESYDHLVLATGAEPRRLGLSGRIPVHGLHTVGDADALAALAGPGKEPADLHAIVIGAGFIGLEAVENLVGRGVRVTLVEYADRILMPLDAEMSAPVHDRLIDRGVEVLTGVGVADLEADTIVLTDGRRIRADLVVESAGVRPRTHLAADAGLTIDESGGIRVNEYHRTDDPSIYAVGDATAKTGLVDGARTLVPLAGLANRHGRAAADAIAGSPTPARPALGTAILGLLGLTVAVTGWNEGRLRAAGRDHRAIHTHPMSHAGYYPGAEQMALKLLVDPETDEILGAQAVGGDGVDKRIDVIATAMTAGLRAADLADLELAYAPQYGSAKDPVNLVGYVARNLREGTTRAIQWHELEEALAAGAALVDVRTPAEHAAGTIPGGINVPLDDLRGRIDELPTGRPIIVHCQVGQRGHTAARILTQVGLDAVNLDGGYLTWRAGMSTHARTTSTGAAR